MWILIDTTVIIIKENFCNIMMRDVGAMYISYYNNYIEHNREVLH